MVKPQKSSVLSDLIEKGFRAKPKDVWPTYDGKELDRTKFVTSSEIGSCARKIKYGKDYPDQADTRGETYGAAQRGHAGEAWVVEQLRRSGAKLMFIGKDQVSFYAGAQSGTPDGVMVDTDGYWLLEIKTIDPRTNIYNLPRDYHQEQCQQNMDLVSHCLDVDVLGTHICHIDASDYEKRYEWTILPDHNRMKELQHRAENIMGTKKVLDIPPEGVYNGGCKWCQYKHLCNGALQQREQEKRDNERLTNVAKNIFG